MSNDVLITPASRKIEFKDSSANVDAKIETDSSGNLTITNPGGDISIGDTTADIFVGDGTNNIDIVFEQDGEIRGTSGVTVTLGASGSNVRMATDLNLNSNDITNVGDLTVSNLTVNGTTTTVNSTNTTIADSIIELNSGLTGANVKDIGFIFERGSTGNNAGFVWDESADRFTVFTTTDTASSDTVNTSSVANFQAGSFYGNGANLSSLNASNLGSGTVPSARLSLSASDIPSLAASKITSGTFADARISSSSVTQHLGSYLTSSSSLNASNISSGTINTARLPNPIHLSGGNAILKLQETDVTNSPTWWHVADGSNYSIRLNNTGAYPIQILTDSDNDAITNIELNYTVDLGGNKLQFGNEATSYIQNVQKQSTDVWRFQTEDGRIDIGSENSSWAHFGTDRNSFYFNPKITVDGNVEPYTDSTRSLGTSSLRWANVYADTLYGDGSNITGVTATDSTKLPLAGGTLTGTLNYRMLQNQSTSNLDTCGDSSGFSVFYVNNNATSKPSGTDHAVLTQSYSNAWQTQIATDWRTKQMYFRTQENGTWKSWATMWHSDNDGASSGLDADKLDGQHGSHYLNYNNFTNTPTIPTNNNQLTNGAGYITSSGNTSGTAGGLSGTPNITVGTISSGAITSSDSLTITGTDKQIKFTGTGGPFGFEFGDTENNPNFRIYYRTSPNTLTFENNGETVKHTFDLSGNYTSTNDITSGASVRVGTTIEMNGGDTNSINFEGTGSDTAARKFAYEASGHHYVTNRHTNGDLILMSNNGSAAGETARITLQAGSGTQDIDITNANLDMNSNNINNPGTVDGRDIATDGSKLDGIESGATADQTASEILTAIKTVDGAGSGLNADVLQGQGPTYYRNASNLNSGTVATSRLPAAAITYQQATDDRDMKPNTSGIQGSIKAIKPFFSSYGGMTGSSNSTYVDVLVLDTYSDSSGGGPNAITFKKGNSAGNPEMHIWHGAWGGTTWSTGQRVFADNYHPNADTLTTARTIAGTSFDGSANIDISYNNLTNKPTIPTNNNQLTNGASYITASSSAVTNKLPLAGGTMTGSINLNGSNLTNINYLQFQNEELTTFSAAYQMVVDANDSDSNIPAHGDYAGSVPFGIYFTGDNGAATTTLGSGLVKVWHTGHFKKAHIDYFVGLYNTGVTTTEFDYLDGVTSNIQTQLNAKLASSSYTASDVLTKIKTVDGSGSGLDADKIDGIDIDASSTAGAIAYSSSSTQISAATQQRVHQGTHGQHTEYTVGGPSGSDQSTGYIGNNYPITGGNSDDFVISGGADVVIGQGGFARIRLDGSYINFFQSPKLSSNLVDQSNNTRINTSGNMFPNQLTVGSSPSKNMEYASSTLTIGSVDDDDFYLNLKGFGGNSNIYMDDADIYVNGTSNSTAAYKFASNGHFHSNGDVIAYSSTLTASDRRLKENVQALENPLEKVMHLQGVRYDWKDKNRGTNQIGLIAQEVEEIVPEVVNTIQDSLGELSDMKVVNYSALVPVLIEAIKQQQEEIERLKELAHPKCGLETFEGYEDLVNRIKKLEEK